MSRLLDRLAKGLGPMSRVAKPNPGERCSRCHRGAGTGACLLCAPHLVSASLVGKHLEYLIELRESKLLDKQLLLSAVQTRRRMSDADSRSIGPVLTIHELSAAGTYLP